AWWERNRQAHVASLLFCYAMGKAQRLLAELARLTDRPVLVHGAVAEVSELYRQQGVSMLATTRVAELPARRSYAGELVLAPDRAWWERNRQAHVASLLFCYAMGKAQRLLAELARLTDRPVLVHGAVAEVSELYRQQGVSMLATTRVAELPARRSYAGELVLA